MTVSESALVAVPPDPLFVTCTVKPAVSMVVGVPVIEPEVERLSPAGKDPNTIAHVYGATPPWAVSVCEYAMPTLPSGSGEVVVMTRVAALIVIESGCVAFVARLSTAWTVKAAVPGLEGVPVIDPDEDRFSPAGSDPDAIDHEYGGAPPAAARFRE